MRFSSIAALSLLVTGVFAMDSRVYEKRSASATSTGTFQAEGPQFHAVFGVDSINYVFTGTSDIPLSPSAQSDATLTYSSVISLGGTHTFIGTQGPNNIRITIDDGSVIESDLIPPVPFTIQISGTGTWASAD